MKPRLQPALRTCLALLALSAVGCGSSSSSSSSATQAPAARTATSSAPATQTAPQQLAPLHSGAICVSGQQHTYVAHGFTCQNGRLAQLAPTHSAPGGSTGTSTGNGSGGAPVSGY